MSIPLLQLGELFPALPPSPPRAACAVPTKSTFLAGTADTRAGLLPALRHPSCRGTPPPGFLQFYAEPNVAFRAKTKRRRKQVVQRGSGLAARSPSNLSEAVDGSPPFFPSLTAQGGMKDERQAAAVGPDPLMGSRGGARCDAIPDPTAGCTAPCWAPHPAQGFRGNQHVPKARGAQEPNKQLLVGKLQNILGKEQPLPPPFSPQRELHVPTALAFVNGTTASRSAPALTSTYCCRKIIIKKKRILP